MKLARCTVQDPFTCCNFDEGISLFGSICYVLSLFHKVYMHFARSPIQYLTINNIDDVLVKIKSSIKLF